MNLPAHKKMLSAAAAASVLLLTAACGSSDSDGAATDTATSAPAASDATTDSTDSADSTDSGDAAVKDGEYSAEGDYTSPAGPSHVAVDLTITDGVVSAVTVTPEATHPTSKQFQTQFAGGISAEVVGKSLDEINVSKVAGSSLTSGGFNDAIEQIKAEAQA
ncbi:hypothetical protein [Aeromicrobium sp. UC242_57]|uniref:hypothetical protein n=1 Tax=Aeromicrobium sp. UC242_57 TaxID=3374624 RepID=UPI0037BA745E